MRISKLFLVSVLAFGPACSKSGDDAKMDKMLTIIESLSSAVESAKDDCGKMATGVEAVVNKHEGDLKDLKTWADDMKKDKEKSKKMMEKYGDRMQKAMPGMMGMMKCADDPKMKAMEAKLKDLM
jgi:hypothetical protein